MADPDARTFYADPDTVLSFAVPPDGAIEEITFPDGKLITSDPGHAEPLERALAAGVVSLKSLPKPETKDAA